MNARHTNWEGGIGKIGKAAVLYDRLETMLVANQLLGWLPPAPGLAADWTVKSWRFDMLENGLEADAALRETQDVELMVVAIENSRHLRDWPEDWLMRWVARHTGLSARLLLVLADGEDSTEAGSMVVGPLRRLAERGRLRVLVFDKTRAGDSPRRSVNGGNFRKLELAAPRVRPPRQSPVRRPLPHFANHHPVTCIREDEPSGGNNQEVFVDGDFDLGEPASCPVSALSPHVSRPFAESTQQRAERASAAT